MKQQPEDKREPQWQKKGEKKKPERALAVGGAGLRQGWGLGSGWGLCLGLTGQKKALGGWGWGLGSTQQEGSKSASGLGGQRTRSRTLGGSLGQRGCGKH